MNPLNRNTSELKLKRQSRSKTTICPDLLLVGSRGALHLQLGCLGLCGTKEMINPV